MEKELRQLEQLELLIKEVKSIKLNSYNEEKIINAIEFEMRLIKRETIDKLGNEAFEKLKKEGGKNGR
jgi:hypothetical protein